MLIYTNLRRRLSTRRQYLRCLSWDPLNAMNYASWRLIAYRVTQQGVIVILGSYLPCSYGSLYRTINERVSD